MTFRCLSTPLAERYTQFHCKALRRDLRVTLHGPRNAPRLLGGRVLHLAEGGMPWTRVVVVEMPDVLFVIYSDSDGNQCQVKTVPVEPVSFTARLDLPKSWTGVRDQALAAVTGGGQRVLPPVFVYWWGAKF